MRRWIPMAEAFAIDVQGLKKSFGGLRALDGVDLRIRPGEIYGLLGPNGTGKTTLIRALVGLVAPDAGTVTVLGRRMPDVDNLRNVGYMTQAAALYPGLSIAENVEFFAAINGADKGVDEVLKLVQLDQRRSSVVATISGGMRQRCSLACALVHKPKLLLLDEPTVILALLGYMIRGSSTVPAVGIANQDQGPLGGMFASALEHSNLISANTIQASDGDAKLKDGSLAAYIVFPSDFSQRAQAGTI